MSELIGEALDLAVAKVIGVDDVADCSPYDATALFRVPAEGKRYFFRPSSSWGAGGPLIERFGIEAMPDGPGAWVAYADTTWGGNERADYAAMGSGPTLLIAAMRCLVELNPKIDGS